MTKRWMRASSAYRRLGVPTLYGSIAVTLIVAAARDVRIHAAWALVCCCLTLAIAYSPYLFSWLVKRAYLRQYGLTVEEAVRRGPRFVVTVDPQAEMALLRQSLLEEAKGLSGTQPSKVGSDSVGDGHK